MKETMGDISVFSNYYRVSQCKSRDEHVGLIGISNKEQVKLTTASAVQIYI